MILWIDEFGDAHVAETLDDSLINAVEDGEASIFMFDIKTERYSYHDGTGWVEIKD